MDLRLDSRSVLVVGGGREATKRIRMMAPEGCRITVASPRLSREIEEMAGSGSISVRRGTVSGDRILEEVRPDMLVAATDDGTLNRRLVESARARGIIAYSSSDPAYSDYSHLAIAEFGETVKVAVSTGGRSPTIAKAIRDEARRALDGVVTDGMLEEIRVQGEARAGAGPGALREGLRRGGGPRRDGGA